MPVIHRGNDQYYERLGAVLQLIEARRLLNKYFGYDSFREGQEQLIEGILAHRDCLGVMPTGAGKSMCFQIPALMFEGITLIISPLISLMKDQVNALTQSGIKAAFINSTLSERQIQLAIDNARYGAYKIIYVAPERLSESAFLDFAHQADISMVTVDEAHCISQWGQDFRPSYIEIADFVNSLRNRPVISAFTATATPVVREDIVRSLQLQDPTVLVSSFDRKNLFFEVQKPKDKFAALLDFLSDKGEKSGIVYCSTRAAVEEACDKLNKSGFNALPYHAGLPKGERHKNQDDFLYDRAQIMVATNAFGMGIDKSNVNYVVHYNMPKDIESYYQEAGRAGRDGENADCLLLYSGQDVRTNIFLVENNKDAVYADLETEKIIKERDRQRLKAMTYYCHTSDCLRSYILKYFGETTSTFCGNCINCNTNFEGIDVTEEAQKILSCIVRTKERYGVKTIVEVLRGSKSEKIMRLGLDKLSTYNISSSSEKRLREIINHLIISSYLYSTDDGYPVLKLTAASKEILYGNETVEMKCSKDIKKTAKTIKTPEKTAPVNKKLFKILRELRLEIANEQNVPAFVIFSDSSLTDMCMKSPSTDEEFLKVSGVGQVKLERYGKRFLEAISNFSQNDSPAADEDEPGDTPSFEDIEISDEAVTIRVIADRINCVLLRLGIKKLTGAKINEWLIFAGYLRAEQNEAGSVSKLPTERGAELNIVSEERTIKKEVCLVNFYGREGQQLIVDRLDEILAFVNAPAD